MYKLTTKKAKRFNDDQVDKVLQVMGILGDITKGGAKQLKEKGFWTAEDGTHFTLRKLDGRPKHKKENKDGLADNNPKDSKVGRLREGTGGSK